MYVHLFNWPVSPSLRWADPVKITASGGAKNEVVQQEPPLFLLGFETHHRVIYFWQKVGNRFLI
jgi:hypothetical protein